MKQGGKVKTRHFVLDSNGLSYFKTDCVSSVWNDTRANNRPRPPLEVLQPTQLIPGLSREPGGGVGVGVVQPDAPREQEAPLRLFHLVAVLQEVHAQHEGEQELGSKNKGSNV